MTFFNPLLVSLWNTQFYGHLWMPKGLHGFKHTQPNLWERNSSRAIEYIDPTSGKEVAELQTAVGWKWRLGNHQYIFDLPLDSSLGPCHQLLTEFGPQIFCVIPYRCILTPLHGDQQRCQTCHHHLCKCLQLQHLNCECEPTVFSQWTQDLCILIMIFMKVY